VLLHSTLNLPRTRSLYRFIGQVEVVLYLVKVVADVLHDGRTPTL
jgi:hypothetical protein